MSTITAEHSLANAGVYKGAPGLRGLAEAQEFWDQQPYGTRLYYGPGIADYLHRDVLQAAVQLLPIAARLDALLSLHREGHQITYSDLLKVKGDS